LIKTGIMGHLSCRSPGRNKDRKTAFQLEHFSALVVSIGEAGF
jgi:hypothetical protein